MDNLISIIIPVYNAEKYLKKCIDSILDQTYSNLEIIIVNDGSKDNSLDIINEYATKDSRIKVCNKENGGVSSARNEGINKANGTYVMFIDADDYIEKDMLKKMYDCIEENNAGICLCGMNVVSTEGEIYRTYTYGQDRNKLEIKDGLIESKENYISLLEVNWAPFCKLIKKDLIQHIRYDKNVAIAEDLLFNAMLLLENSDFKVAVCSEAMYNYVDVPTSATKSSYSSKILQGLITEEKVYNMLSEIDKKDRLSKVLFSGVITFFFRYATADKAVQKEYIEDYKKAIYIVKKHKKYLLEKRARSRVDILKMVCICYMPRIYIVLRNLAKR